MRSIRNPQSWDSGRPYSPAVAVDGWLYVSGHVPVDSDGNTVGSDGQQQAEQVLDNIEKTLSTAGAGLADVVSTIVYLTDMKDIAAVDEVYRARFSAVCLPSRTTVQISSLGRAEFRVEISAVARSRSDGPA